jgi:predicted Zn-dependent peptidase
MNTRLSELANGVRVVTEEMPNIETASIGVWVDVGARDERPEVNGVSHLLEHMAFKGTERRSAQRIAEEIEAVGGHLNAYTSREQTAYYAKVMKEDVPLAVDLLSDILQHSVFDAEELAREKQVVLQEIAQAHDTPDDIVFDYFQATAYPLQPIGRSILGPTEQVANYQRDVLDAYMKEHYSAPRLVVVGAGNLSHDTLVELAGNAFDRLPAGTETQRSAASYAGGDDRRVRDLEQLHFILGFDGIRYDDPDFMAMQTLSTLLGGGMSSRLFQEIREKRGLAYSVFTFGSSYIDGGTFGVYAGTGPEDIGALIPVMSDEILKVCDVIGKDELARARAQLKSGLLMSLESSSARIERLGRQTLIYGRPLSLAELIARIEEVTPDDVTRVARRLFTQTKPTVTALGLIGGIDDYERLAARFA